MDEFHGIIYPREYIKEKIFKENEHSFLPIIIFVIYSLIFSLCALVIDFILFSKDAQAITFINFYEYVHYSLTINPMPLILILSFFLMIPWIQSLIVGFFSLVINKKFIYYNYIASSSVITTPLLLSLVILSLTVTISAYFIFNSNISQIVLFASSCLIIMIGIIYSISCISVALNIKILNSVFVYFFSLVILVAILSLFMELIYFPIKFIY